MKTSFNLLLMLCCLVLCAAPAAAKEAVSVSAGVQKARDAGVDDALLNRLLSAGLSHQNTQAHMAGWLDLVATAAQEDLPAGLLVGKVEEGLSKHVDGSRIDRALEHQLRQLRFAGRMVRHFETRAAAAGKGNHARYAAMERISGLLSAGMSEQMVEQFFADHAEAPFSQRIEALTFRTVLNQSGLAPDSSERIVQKGLRHGYFHVFPVDLARTAKTAVRQSVDKARIESVFVDVVSGRQTLENARQRLGIQRDEKPSGRRGAVFPERGGQAGPSGAGRGGRNNGGSGGGAGGHGGSGAGGNGSGSGNGH